MVGDAKPVAFVEDTAVAPDRLPEFYERFFAIVGRHGRAGRLLRPRRRRLPAHPADPQRQDRARGSSQLRSIAREVSDLVVEFGGAMSGEHGDGLARSLWNAKLFGPEVYAALRGGQARLRPRQPDEPRQGRRRARPRRQPPDRPRLPRPSSPSRPSSTSPARAGSPGAVEMCSGVGACRKNGGGTMCPSYMVTRDEEHTTRGRANALRLVMSGELARRRPGRTRRSHEALDLCLQCKACKSECPSNVDMAKLKAEVLHQNYQGRPVPARLAPDGPHPPAQPDRLGDGPAGQLDAAATRRSSGSWRRSPGSTAGGPCRRSPPTTSARGSAGTRPDPRAGHAGHGRPARRLLHDLQHPRGRPRGGPGAGGGAATGSSWRACPAAAGRRSRRGC